MNGACFVTAVTPIGFALSSTVKTKTLDPNEDIISRIYLLIAYVKLASA